MGYKIADRFIEKYQFQWCAGLQTRNLNLKTAQYAQKQSLKKRIYLQIFL